MCKWPSSVQHQLSVYYVRTFTRTQGRLMEKSKSLSKGELLSMVRFGADNVFKVPPPSLMAVGQSTKYVVVSTHLSLPPLPLFFGLPMLLYDEQTKESDITDDDIDALLAKVFVPLHTLRTFLSELTTP
jgi:hypothetical protein